MEPRSSDRLSSSRGTVIAAMIAAVIIAIGLASTSARADAIGVPDDCVAGAIGMPNPRHGTGWCQPAPCASDADCQPRGFHMRGMAPDVPRTCGVVGVCYWGDHPNAIGSCDREGAPCSAPGYGGEGVCRVRPHCGPAPAGVIEPASSQVAPEALPQVAPVAPRQVPARAETPTAPRMGCSASGADGSTGLAIAALAILALVAGARVVRIRRG